MITIRDGGDGEPFRKITNWEDITERPNFEQKVDPKKIKLKQIVGHYSIDPQQPCGLKNCGTNHNRGYLVEVEGGIVTNIGNICGKRYFDVDFTNLQRAFKKDYNAQRYREELTKTKHQLAGIKKQIEDLRNGDHKGDWCYKNMHQHVSRLFPLSITDSLIKRSNRGNGVVEKDIMLTGKDKAIAEQAGNKDGFKTETVFIINGITSVVSYKKIKKILNVYLGEELVAFSQVDIETADFETLKRWNNWSNKIERRLREVKVLIDECNRFLMPANVNNIRRYQSYL